MADTETPVTTEAASPAPVTDSASASPVPETPVSSSEPSAPAAAPAEAPTEKSVEPAVEKPAEEAKKEESSLLGTEPPAEVKPEDKKVEDKKPEAKPEDKKPEEKPAEVKPEDAPLPTYEEFKLPETFKVDEKVMGKFTGLLGKLELAKGDHKATQEIGQKMADLYAANMAEATQKMTDYYTTYWNKTKQDRLDELRKDAYFGASGDTTKQTQIQMEMASFLQRNVPKAELTEFRKFAVENGIDNALPVARLINTLKQKIDKYEKESANMLPGTKPAPMKTRPGQAILQTLYGKK